MLCGQFIGTPEQKIRIGTLGVVSNRATPEQQPTNHVDALDPTQADTYGLSNSAFTEPWPKVTNGIQLLDTLAESVRQGVSTEQDIISQAFNILTHDTLSSIAEEMTPESKVGLLKTSIFIPAFDTGKQLQLNNQNCSTVTQPAPMPAHVSGTDAKRLYGTQKQTVILVHESGQVRFLERTRFDWLQGNVPGDDNMVDFVFNIET
ncbi:hypothetical protein DRE_06932 [Drechslerella stenobrocha 248]|uniref:Uncharacterized protein n=1 Tax=Drechslerella stenobrocha 248 TaxID=1043628 RepID=W7HVV1_9PEZI|nr:hypothetical protein DRE_06932 [Drechslerella stenobrocha 248]